MPLYFLPVAGSRPHYLETSTSENSLDFGVHSHKLQITMTKHILLFSVAALAIAFFSPAPPALAHERDTFKIGGNYYVLTVGSLNEPFVVDNLSGVDLRVSRVTGPAGSDSGEKPGTGTPVTGLERTLKVELAAGDRKEALSFVPSGQAPGAYAADFIPTVQTTYIYRIFGTIEGSPVDLAFACVTGEVSEAAQDKSEIRVSDTVTRLNKIGAFACPAPRKSVGFPEPALSSYELSQGTQNLAATAQAAGKQAVTAEILGAAGIISGLLGLGVAGIAWKQKQAGHP
jgi:hypothetical protein